MSYTSVNYDMLLKESVNWPLVAASPGFFTVDPLWPSQEPEAVLAWRVGPELTLPVTRHGYRPDAAYVVHPNGKIRFHGLSISSAVPDYESIEAWRADNEADRVIGSATVLMVPKDGELSF
jgi:hypothetical protein